MIIRDVGKEDRDTFFSMARDFYNGDATLFSLPQSHLEDAFLKALSGSPLMRVLLLFEETDGKETPIGYAHLAFTWTLEAGGRVCWLEEIYLSPAYRGKGLGKTFMAWLLDAYQDTCKRFRLEVCPHNLKVQKLYQEMGFTELPYLQMMQESPRSQTRG